MKLKTKLMLMLSFSAILACQPKEKENPLIGTWQLVSAETIEKDTSFSTFNPKVQMIKIINPTHFAFMSHVVNPAKDSTNSFSAGGGEYTLVDSVYTENLQYFIDKNWENNKFTFTVKIQNDTLIQKGIEKIEKLGIDHVIIEKYVKVKK
ncbi:hypothetical protein VB776_03195 [Arcicella sp. DC2W]|uniref:Lipocalin-like domain-containing protein n=1 Tax=Arcicella gelida TaxID=2984195 RepID=A0ABU5S098_9BACT|nr:hypothetical protein [Arcicella sp. DC2W]MEA5401907.1 hypothetical protein [Arcicella sp. DC2W]